MGIDSQEFMVGVLVPAKAVSIGRNQGGLADAILRVYAIYLVMGKLAAHAFKDGNLVAGHPVQTLCLVVDAYVKHFTAEAGVDRNEVVVCGGSGRYILSSGKIIVYLPGMGCFHVLAVGR